MYVYVYILLYIRVYIYICMYVYIHIYTYTHWDYRCTMYIDVSEVYVCTGWEIFEFWAWEGAGPYGMSGASSWLP